MQLPVATSSRKSCPVLLAVGLALAFLPLFVFDNVRTNFIHHLLSDTTESHIGPVAGQLLPPSAPTGQSQPNASAPDRASPSSGADALKKGPSQPPSLPRCAHVVMFTSPRHGSTWLVDSIERCKYSNGTKSFGDANWYAELWNPGQRGPLFNLTAEEAVEYIARNGSVKLFPVALERDARFVVDAAVRRGFPIFLLRRDAVAVFQSVQNVRIDDVWNRVRKPSRTSEREAVQEDDERFVGMRRNLQKFFEKAEALLSEVGATKVDDFTFEDIYEQEFIVARNNGCYIHNCNFL